MTEQLELNLSERLYVTNIAPWVGLEGFIGCDSKGSHGLYQRAEMIGYKRTERGIEPLYVAEKKQP